MNQQTKTAQPDDIDTGKPTKLNKGLVIAIFMLVVPPIVMAFTAIPIAALGFLAYILDSESNYYEELIFLWLIFSAIAFVGTVTETNFDDVTRELNDRMNQQNETAQPDRTDVDTASKRNPNKKSWLFSVIAVIAMGITTIQLVDSLSNEMWVFAGIWAALLFFVVVAYFSRKKFQR